jgi:hypothetical protein
MVGHRHIHPFQVYVCADAGDRRLTIRLRVVTAIHSARREWPGQQNLTEVVMDSAGALHHAIQIYRPGPAAAAPSDERLLTRPA